MELDLLRSFVAVTEARSFSRATRTMHSTQPTLSRQIAHLEQELAARLFERYGRHLDCTPAGQVLLPLAKAIIARTDEAITLVQERAGMRTNCVRFGTVGNIMALLLTPVIVSFLETHPRSYWWSPETTGWLNCLQCPCRCWPANPFSCRVPP